MAQGNRLIQRLEVVDLTSTEDALVHFAAEIESALITAGAAPGEYSRLDLITLAQPFALEAMKGRNCF
ncbi:hypothetical protein Ga0061063_0958 [Gulbenkiania indica]|uniref:Uncharacterized protein n=1 Tax=Gulbenkiania indica TaxID=375574 RepID=A0A0K6GU36_9NEIS|nr:hypothetical protein [Gulbenkiania indica]CUA82103.1 hypothetical protein Ga0061063_0958 [Gulbenkiania indica]